MFLAADIFEFQRTDESIDGFGIGFDHDNIANPNFLDPGASRQTLAIAHQTDDRHIDIFRLFVQFTNFFTNDARTIGNTKLGNIVLDMEQRFGCTFLFVRHWNQTPTDQGDKDDTNQCDYRTDGRKIKHPKWLTDGLLTKTRDDDIGWCSNQRDHATQNRCK